MGSHGGVLLAASFLALLLVGAWAARAEIKRWSKRRRAKVYELSEYDWWVGYDAESTMQDYLKKTGVVRGDDCYANAIKLTAEQLNYVQFVDNTDEPSIGDRSFREELDRLIESDRPIPGFFAACES